MRVLSNKWTGVAAYLVFVTGMCAICANLSSYVARQAITLALPYLPDDGPRQLSLVERRQIDAAQGVQPSTERAEIKEVLLTVPAISPQTMAAQLDRAEREEFSDAPPPTRRVRYSSRRVAPPSLSAAEEFGRRFGVFTVAAR
jgi:hypothetical protein